jgi:hypothetical protein
MAFFVIHALENKEKEKETNDTKKNRTVGYFNTRTKAHMMAQKKQKRGKTPEC